VGETTIKSTPAEMGNLLLVTSICTMLLASLELIGWILGWQLYAAAVLPSIPMAPSTAICFILLALIGLTKPRNTLEKTRLTVSILVIILVTIFCGLDVLESLGVIGLDAEGLILPEPQFLNGFPLARMSPMTATLLILSAGAMLLLVIRLMTGEKYRRLGHISGLIGCVVAFSGFTLALGYLYGTPLLYKSKFVPVAGTTALGFVFLGLAVLARLRSDDIPKRYFVASAVHRQLSQAFVPLVFFAVILQGILSRFFPFVMDVNNALLSALVAGTFAVIAVTVASKIISLVGDEIVRAKEALQASEERLRASEARYRAIFDNAGIGIDLLDRDGKILEVNRSLLDMLGYSEEELRPLSFLDITHPEDKEVSKRNLESLVAGEIDFYRFEKRYLRKDGSVLWADLTTSAICGPNGEHTGTIGVISDITQRKQTEEALRESEQRYRAFFETSRDSVFMTGLDGQFIDFNDVALEVFGYDKDNRDELLRANVASVYANPEERTAHVALVAKQGFSREYPIDLMRRDGTIIHALVTAAVRRDAHGCIIGFQGTVRDITEQKRAQEALRTTLNRFYTILSSLYAGLLIVTEESRVEFANQAFCDLFDIVDPPDSLHGLTAPEMIAKIQHMYAQPAEAVARIQEVVAENRPIRGEQIAMRGGRTYLVDYVPIIVEGKGSGRLWHHNDITDLKKAEEARESLSNQLLQAQKMESIGTLTGGIAHDFNNLLTIMNGYTELILSERTEGDPICADLHKILETGQKGAEMVHRLLTFGKRSELKLKPLELNLVVQNLASLLARTLPKMVEITTDLEEDLGTVNADPIQIEQVLMNLCLNAKEAMPRDGKLTIRTRNVNIDNVDCGYRVNAKPGPHVLIEVSDTGVGMDRGTMDRMFEPFFTTKGWDFNKGTGLGLSVARGIVEQHGGWITCESEPGKGTAFKVYIPVIERAPVTEKSVLAVGKAPSSKMILLVDDEEHVRDLAKRILERAGYVVITAVNGSEALEIYEHEQAKIALVVLDLVMPRMGGEKCLEELVRINPYVKVVVSSGHSLDSRERDHLGAYAKGFVSKPYQMRQFLDVVKGVLASE
jgi:two-component system cell cycle sensor histidine kinase/response regulator CckA